MVLTYSREIGTIVFVTNRNGSYKIVIQAYFCFFSQFWFFTPQNLPKIRTLIFQRVHILIFCGKTEGLFTKNHGSYKNECTVFFNWIKMHKPIRFLGQIVLTYEIANFFFKTTILGSSNYRNEKMDLLSQVEIGKSMRYF